MEEKGDQQMIESEVYFFGYFLEIYLNFQLVIPLVSQLVSY
jgi:hypothetical protein